MLTFDLHFHANIHRLPNRNKRLRLQKIHWYLKKYELDFLASTEHSYKNPLEAYQRLADTTADLKTSIIPGVESVSSEGIDIIYLYRDEDHLKWALDQFQSFNWTIRDVLNISRDTDAISIIPHPFHIGRTSAGNILSKRAYKQLLKMADYVEIHNGSALTIDKRLSASRTKQFFEKTQLKLDKTLNLPLSDRGNDLGWSIGSDAHFPGEQYIVGRSDIPIGQDEHIFDYLSKRIQLEPHILTQPSTRKLVNNIRLLRSLQSIMKEGLVKEYLKTKGRTQTILATGFYYGFFSTF